MLTVYIKLGKKVEVEFEGKWRLEIIHTSREGLWLWWV